VFGARIDTDVLAPGALMKLDPEDLAMHCLRAVRPEFASEVRPGDMIVAGPAFGIGSSREQAAVSLKLLGLAAVVAPSFARIFFRNAFNLGLPALRVDGLEAIADGNRLALDLAGGALDDLTTGRSFRFPPVPAHLQAIIAAGGLMAHLKSRAQANGTVPQTVVEQLP
jgi:3-isopropylmalate/(R)-2-methylmalate dehydratase small subunit